MGLINIFNIQKLRPHINYRFSAEIWPNAAEGDKIKEYTKFQYTVKKITQPVYKLNTENKKVYGNTAYVVPVFKYGETSLEITFEETDTMEVFKQLCTWMGPNLHKGYLPPLINIRITQFNESMVDVVDKRVYVCRLKEHGMPSFNNNGFGSPIEITATFNVVYVMDEPLTLESYNANNEINRYTTEYALPENKALNDALAKSLKDYKNTNSYGYKIFKAEAALANKKIDELTVENSDLNKDMMEQLDLAYAKIMENATDEQRALMQQIAKSKGGITMRNQVENLLNYFNAEARAEQDAKTKESGTSADYELIKFNAVDGVDNYETEAVERFLKLTNTDEKTAEEIRNILFKMNENAERIGEFDEAIKKADADALENGLMKDYESEDDLNKAIKEAMVSIEAEASKGEPLPTRSSYNGSNPFLAAISASYEKEVGTREGERGHVFFDMLDAGNVSGTINLGSGSSEGARGYSDIGEITVNIDGVTMKFKNSASLNRATQEAFGGKEKIMTVFKENGGGKGYTTEEERKKADVKGAKEGLNKLLETTGGVITDDYGNTSVVKLDKGNGIYLNIQLDEDSSQKVSDKNMIVNTIGWSESTRQAVIDSADGSPNRTIQGMLHFQHAYSGFKNVWKQFSKDESNVQMINEDIKNGTFRQATLDALSRSVDKLKIKDNLKKSFKRVIREYGYTS